MFTNRKIKISDTITVDCTNGYYVIITAPYGRQTYATKDECINELLRVGEDVINVGMALL